MSASRNLGAALAALCAGLVLCGCSTTEKSLEYDGAHPLIRFSNNGIRFKDEFVTPKQAVELLEENYIPHEATIHILVDDDYTDRRATWVFQHNYLARAGYNRSVLVTKRVASSETVERKPKKIRYKKSNE